LGDINNFSIRKFLFYEVLYYIVNCVICGRESTKPVCEECTHKIMEEYPFLLRKSFIGVKEIFDLKDSIKRGIITDENLNALNDMAKRGLRGEEVDFELLTEAALLFHKRYSFYLENFEIDGNYYLSLADIFSQNVEGEGGKFLRYEVLRESGNLRGALKLIDSLAKSRDKEYLLEKASLLLEMGEKDEAQRIYIKVLEDEHSWEHFACTLYDLAEYESSAEAYMHVIELNPKRWEAYYNLARCLLKMGKHRDAVEYLEKDIEINKYHIEAYALLYRLYGELEMNDKRRELENKFKRIGFDIELLGVEE
jgi:tetratricopeptide (TPR) repeat protein